MGAEFKVGDRVKVTQEGVVTRVWAEFDPTDEGISVTLAGEETTFGHGLVESGRVTFEKVEPPVEVFKPGVVVRWQPDLDEFECDEYDRALGQDGYVLIGRGIAAGRYYRYGDGEHAGHPKSYFTSERFERVEV